MCPRTAREDNCRNLQDDDGDGRTDCADPDCALRACDDGKACTSFDECDVDAGHCRGTPDDNACISPPSQCFAPTGACQMDGTCLYGPRTGACNDGIACTDNDACRPDGGCEGTGRVTAGANQCTREVCNLSTGLMQTVVRQGEACDAGRCVVGATCTASQQCAGAPRDCGDAGPTECSVYTCDANTGACAATANRPEGWACTNWSNQPPEGNYCRRPQCLANGICGDTGAGYLPEGSIPPSRGGDPAWRCCRKTPGVTDLAEVDITSNAGHCGGCGITCSAGQACRSCATESVGRCACDTFTCPTGQSCTGFMLTNLCQPVGDGGCASGQTVVHLPACSVPQPSFCRYP